MADIRSGRPPRMAVEPGPPAPVAATERGRPAPVPKARPDARPLRIAFGMGALAAASALVTALASPPYGGASAADTQTTITQPADPLPSVRHVIQYVHLKPGQTAPPNTVVKQAPAPKPRVVVVTTRQSGAKP
jgi:hypothetical protein